MTDEQIKHMVNRFLSWRLPANFSPDAGISFKAEFNEHTRFPSRHQPMGTNLFDYTQAEAMVRHMVEGLLLPPAPDGATEGWRLVPVEPTEAMLAAARPSFDEVNAIISYSSARTRSKGLSHDPLPDAYRAMLAASPSVSPVGPKGEDAAAKALFLHMRHPTMHESYQDAEWAEHPDHDVEGPEDEDGLCAVEPGRDYYRRLARIALAPSQPTQTGEENAGLVELIIQHLAKYAGPLEGDGSDEPAGGDDFCGYLTYDGLDRLADALASRSPIPGELKALSDAATAGPWTLAHGPFGWDLDATEGTENDPVFVGRLSNAPDADFVYAAVNHVRQALAKTHQVAEGGVASAADSA